MTNLTTQFTTEYDGTGVDGFQGGMTQVESSLTRVNTAGTTFSTNYEALGRKMERPLSRLAFAGVASELLGTGEAAGGASKALVSLEQGLHAIGNALLFVQPEFGLLAIGLTAVITLFAKLSGASEVNAEKIAKQVSEIDQQQQKYKDSADTLYKAGIIDKEQVKILNDLSDARAKERQQVIDSLQVKKEFAENELRQAKQLQDSHSISQQKLMDQIVVDEATQKLAKITQAMTGLEDHYAQAQKTSSLSAKDLNHSVEDQYNTLAKLMTLRQNMDKNNSTASQKQAADQQIQSLNALGITYQNASTAIIKNQLEVARMEQELTNTTDTEKRKQIQTTIEWFNRTIQAQQAVVNVESQIRQKRIADAQKFSSEMLSGGESFMKDFVQGNKANLDKDLGNWIDSYANKLFAASVADAFLDPVKAAGELAGAAALWALAGPLSNGAATGSAAASASPSVASNPNPTNNIGLTLILQGTHVTDPNFSLKVAQGLSDIAQNNNAQVVATHFMTPSGKIVSF